MRANRWPCRLYICCDRRSAMTGGAADWSPVALDGGDNWHMLPTAPRMGSDATT